MHNSLLAGLHVLIRRSISGMGGNRYGVLLLYLVMRRRRPRVGWMTGLVG
jgi:hypothetical protein